MQIDPATRKYKNRYLLSAALALIVLVLLSVFVKHDIRISPTENLVFNFFYDASSKVGLFLSSVMQFGAVVFVFFAAAVAYLYNKPKLARDFVLSGVGAWLVAKIVKEIVQRPRPYLVLNDILIRSEDATGYGFPSGHMAVAAGLGFILWPYVNRTGKVCILTIMAMVGAGRMYVGAHYPLDIVGGFLCGLFAASAIYVAFRFEKEMPKETVEETYIYILDKYKINKKLVHYAATIGLIAVSFAILLPFLHTAPKALALLSKMDWRLAIPVLIGSFFTYVFAAITQQGALSKKLNMGDLLLVQMASSYTNRIAPAGIGGIGLNMKYFLKHGVGKEAALTAIAVKTFVSAISSILLAAIALFVTGEDGTQFIHVRTSWVLIALALILVIIVAYQTIPALRKKTGEYLERSIEELKKLHDPRQYALLAIGAFGMTFAYGLTMYVAATAVHVPIPVFPALLVYIIGSTVGSIYPTPGGIGGAEASLTGAMVFLGFPADASFAAVLLFRLATFWIPTFAGMAAFFTLRKKKKI